MPAADDANNPACAEITVRLPESLGAEGEFPRRWTDAQATAAWGDPTAAMLSCGVAVPGPSTLQCVTFGGVDWVVDISELPYQRITTYGRNPATQVYVNTEVISPSVVLEAISPKVKPIEATASCVALEDATPAPAPTDG
ncbi:DUF3515 family protein [Microbacterium sp. NEAU-LLB]|uniref:DUF3515 family protein n=2 Tax=Microbacterium stercoris TaxID=2820289 RepID=A0A939QR07_9MICO|nr:DUF3515 family protein [Microbacterium stercoris]